MRAFFREKDGGAESTVTGYWLFEAKRLCSAVLLRFDGQSREAFHNHAFNCISWVLKGGLTETMLDGSVRRHEPSWRPFVTRRSDFHKVDSDEGRTWVLSFRGPWMPTWREFLPNEDCFVTLTNGRREVGRFGLAAAAAAGLTLAGCVDKGRCLQSHVEHSDEFVMLQPIIDGSGGTIFIPVTYPASDTTVCDRWEFPEGRPHGS
ncbi:hypothetical protein [Sphingomonas jaspsi]|uniref:hypothetical protein n=1 Tax=Sphingomonas jaspsi TaxID=392409 RepID=UPI0004B65ABB|nr:hypothetical protein [Sphingomonas jaspsi]